MIMGHFGYMDIVGLDVARRRMGRVARAALTVLASMAAGVAWPHTYLVAVGIGDYPGTDMDLVLPSADARTVAAIYRHNSGASVRLLLDSQATASAVTEAMDDLFAKAGPDDEVILFYSGHGYKGGFCAYDGPLTYEAVRSSMGRGRSERRIVFADACYSGKIRTPGTSGTPSPGDMQLMLLLSSRSDETSIESPHMSNGYFTAALERGLRGGADADRDRVITARELFDYVSLRVKEATFDRQHPVMWGRFADDMPVISW